MRTIVHLSDLHFGRLDRRVVAPLVAAIQAIAPDLVAVSGDFTQRARTRQFVEARDFLEKLPSPRLVVLLRGAFEHALSRHPQHAR